MKKIFCGAVLLLTGALLFSCNTIKKDSTVGSVPETTAATITTTETTTAEPTGSVTVTTQSESKPPAKPVKLPTKGVVLYDNAGMFTETGKKNVQEILDKVTAEHMMSAAVVTTNDLKKMSPYEFAEDAFKKIFEESGRGVLLLINNDTNEDIFYKCGSIAAYITAEDEETIIFEATQKLVGGDAEGAVKLFMSLLDKAPTHIFDNAGIFTSEQVEVLEKAASESETSISLVFDAAENDEESAKRSYAKRYPKKDGIMVLYNTSTNKMTAHSDKALPDELKKSLEAANKLSGNAYKKAASLLGAETE